MALKQVSVFLENRTGQLAEVTNLLSGNGINLRALNIAETQDYGVLRLIADDPLKTAELITDFGLPVSLTPVSAVVVPDRPGGLSELLNFLAERNIDVEYMYSLLGTADGKAVMIFRTADADALEKLIREGGYESYCLN